MKLILLLFSLNVFAGVTINGTPLTVPNSSTDGAIVTWDGTNANALGNITNAPTIGSDGDIVLNKVTGSTTDLFIGANGVNTGFYFGSGGPTSQMGYVFNGTNIWDSNATSFNFRIRGYFAGATCSSPGWGKLGDTNTGLCTNEADHLGIATDGTERLSVFGEAVVVKNGILAVQGQNSSILQLIDNTGGCWNIQVNSSGTLTTSSITCQAVP